MEKKYLTEEQVDAIRYALASQSNNVQLRALKQALDESRGSFYRTKNIIRFFYYNPKAILHPINSYKLLKRRYFTKR